MKFKLLIIFLLLCPTWVMATFSFKPSAPVVGVGERTTLSVAGAMGTVRWQAFDGEIKLKGDKVIYIAPMTAGIDVVTVMDEANNVGTLNITVLSAPDIAQTFSLDNASWQLFNSRNMIRSIRLSRNGEIMWVGTDGGLEKREAVTGRLLKVFTHVDGLLGGVGAIYRNEEDGLWMGTAGGLAYLPATGPLELIRPDNSGLTSGIVSSILPDGEGGLWIGMIGFPKEADGGIAHFKADGQWEIMNQQNTDLPTNDIGLLKMDAKGELWAVGNNGLFEMRRLDEKGHFALVPGPGPGLMHRNSAGNWEVFHLDNSGLPSLVIQDFQLDSQDGVWLSTDDKGLAYRAADGQWEVFNTSNSGLPSDKLHNLLLDAAGTLWIGIADGRLTQRNAAGEWATFSDPQQTDFSDDIFNMRGFFIDAQQRFWFSNAKSGLSYRTQDDKWQRLDASALPSNFVRTVLLDGHDLWVGTRDKGLAHRRADGQWETWYQNTSDLPNEHIHALLSDQQGGLWIGTEGGLAHYTPPEQWTIYTRENAGLPSNRINALSHDEQGGLWVGIGFNQVKQAGRSTIRTGGLAHLSATGEMELFTLANSDLPSSHITALATDGNGGLWVGTAAFYLEENGSTQPFSRSAGLAHLTKKSTWTVFNKDNSELPANDIQVLHLDDDDGLWIGTGYQHYSEPYGEAGGLAHRFSDGRWEVFNNQNTILQNSVQAIQADERGGLWIGSYRGGIAHRKADGAWELFATFNSGIPGNEVYSLATDGNDHLWLGTDNGVAHLSFGKTLSGDLSGQRAAILIHPESRGGTIKHLSSEKISSYAYQVLSERYYRHDEIYFVAYKPEMDINGDYRADINAVDAPVKFAEKANGAQTRSLRIDDIREAFEWAKEQGTLNQPLLVVLVAEGLAEGQLLLDPDSRQGLTAPDLKVFLDDYQTSTGNSVVIVIEASYAGKLIPELASDENRIIITSTSADEATQHTDVLGQDAFSWRYFNELRRGNNFWDAFHHASSRLSQQPQIEDNQRSGRLAKQFCLNGCFTLRLNQTVYHDGDTLRISLPLLPSGKVPYIGIGLPDGSAVYTLSEKNGFMAFDGTILSAWQDGDVVVEWPITSDLARGEYPLYLLRVKEGVEPLGHPAFWELNVGAMRIE